MTTMSWPLPYHFNHITFLQLKPRLPYIYLNIASILIFKLSRNHLYSHCYKLSHFALMLLIINFGLLNLAEIYPLQCPIRSILIHAVQIAKLEWIIHVHIVPAVCHYWFPTFLYFCSRLILIMLLSHVQICN